MPKTSVHEKKKGQNKYEMSEINGLEYKVQRICLNTPVRGLIVDY